MDQATQLDMNPEDLTGLDSLQRAYRLPVGSIDSACTCPALTLR